MLLTFLSFFIILSLLILVHELGHFLVAKKAGILVEEFGLGLPPRIFGKKIGETIYSLNLLPIGGFVKLYGEEEEVSDDKAGKNRQFINQKPKVRAAVTIAGVLMNFLLGVVVFSIIYNLVGIPTKIGAVKVVEVVSDSPAQLAGLKNNDVILKAGEREIKDSEAFLEETKNYAGKEMLLEVGRQDDNPCRNQVLGAQPGVEISCRNGNLVLKVVPRENPPAGEGPLGVVISDVEQKFYPWYQMIPLGIWQGLKEALGWLTLISQSLAGMIYQLIFQGVVPRDVAGPIGIFQITGTAVKFGFLSVLQFLGVLSINLAVINILPLPALDGGRFVFIAYEAVTKRKPNARLEARIHAAGMVFLLGLILLITINDLLRIIKLVIGN